MSQSSSRISLGAEDSELVGHLLRELTLLHTLEANEVGLAPAEPVAALVQEIALRIARVRLNGAAPESWMKRLEEIELPLPPRSFSATHPYREAERLFRFIYRFARQEEARALDAPEVVAALLLTSGPEARWLRNPVQEHKLSYPQIERLCGLNLAVSLSGRLLKRTEFGVRAAEELAKADQARRSRLAQVRQPSASAGENGAVAPEQQAQEGRTGRGAYLAN